MVRDVIPAPESGGRHRNRRVSAEQGGDVMKLLSGEEAAQAVVSLAHRYASFDPGRREDRRRNRQPGAQRRRRRAARVRTQIRRARRGRAHARPAEEMQAALAKVSPELHPRHRDRGKKHPQLRRVATAPPLVPHHSSRPARGPGDSSAGVGRLLRSRRPLSAAFHRADDGNSRAGRGRQAHRRRLAASCAGNLGRRGHHRRHRVLPHRRRAGDRRLCLRHRRAFPRSTRSSVPATHTSPWQKSSSPSIAASTSSPARPRSSTAPPRATRSSSPATWSRRPSTTPRRWPSSSPPALVSQSR